MKINQWYKEQSIILKIAYITLGVSIIMFILYFIFVRGHFSNKSIEWANFGAYFGSITGLLAFVGVLYTASLSEKRAEKAEQESIKREERDQFFKMLELVREQSQLLQITSGKEQDEFVSNIQNQIVNRLVYYFIDNIKFEEWIEFKKDYNSSPESKNIGSDNFLDKVTDIFIYLNRKFTKSNKESESPLESVDIFLIKLNLEKSEYNRAFKNSMISIEKNALKRNDLDELFSFLEKKLSNEILTNALEDTARLYYSTLKKYITLCKSISLLVESINNFSQTSRELFYEIISSQFKSNDLIIFYIYLFSDHYNSSKIEPYLYKKLFTNLSFKDFIIINRVSFKNQEDLQLSILLSEYMNKHNH